ncbi:MAG: NAD-dependent epimerase/dehydratase family protein [Anaerolineales bacterium]|nr:NAD-dependent epimerase/dehydratase family protein [Anaerolineales bacterium]
MKALITGATGFVGGSLARRVKGMGWDVTGTGRNAAKLKELEAQGVRAAQADITQAERLKDLFKGQEVVFHCAALPTPWGRYEDFYQANVVGTRNVAQACLENNVKRLVHVSTPSFYFDYRSRLNVKEADVLKKPITPYAVTKLLAEAEVDKAFAAGLPVVSIRPRALFGEGDTVVFPRLIKTIQSGKLAILGDGQNVIDLSYIGNVLDALLLCVNSPASTLGKKYNISNGEPVKIWDVIFYLCDQLGYPRPTKRIPLGVTLAAAMATEFIYSLKPGRPEPPLTRLSVSLLAYSSTVDISAAKNELGYNPTVPVFEGVDRFLKQWKAEQAA